MTITDDRDVRSAHEVLALAEDWLTGEPTDALAGLQLLADPQHGTWPGTNIESFDLPPRVLLAAIEASQRLVAWARAQESRWTAALARPGVAVPVSQLLDSLAHRADQLGLPTPIPDHITEQAASGHTTFADPEWDARIAGEAASFAEPELSAALHIAPITARRRIARALELVDDLPDTHAALEGGQIDDIRARIIAESTACLDPEPRHRAEERLLDAATPGITPGDLTRLAATTVIDIDPDAAGRRAEKARANRGTCVIDLGDDQGRFQADLALEDATLTQAVLDAMARAVPHEHRAGRGASQLRADLFADLFLQLAHNGHVDLRGGNGGNRDTSTCEGPTHTGPGRDTSGGGQDASTREGPTDTHTDASAPSDADAATDATPELTDATDPTRRGGLLAGLTWPHGVRLHLDVTVPLSTLAGRTNLAGQLAGGGVITADLARALAASAETVRLVVTGPLATSPPDAAQPTSPHHSGIHPGGADCGTVLDLGRTVYRPTDPVKDHVETRDQRCRFPSCAMPARRCDKDHRIAWDDGGATCPCNLDCLCRFHHRIKTFTAWTATRIGNTLTWTSPIGRTHHDRPRPGPGETDQPPTDKGQPPGSDDPPF